MRIAVRTAFGVAVALFATLVLAVTSVVSVTALAATTALIMGGTGDPLTGPRDTNEFVEQYLGMAENNYIAPSSNLPTGIPQGPYNAVAVITPAEWSTDGSGLTLDQSVAEGTANLHNCISGGECVFNTDVGSAAPAPGDSFVVFGYSQSAMIATLEKRRLAAEFADGEGPDVTFVLIGNGNRPNGGFLARGPQGFTIPMPFLFAGATFNGSTPTDTQYDTADIVTQYDIWADAPLNPLNIFAMANWYSSATHYNYPYVSLDDPGVVDQGQYGDTHYYMAPTRILPLLQPLTGIPVVGFALADALDAPFRVLVEAGYDRSASPGQPMPWNPLYFGDPVKLVINLAVSIPTGIDNGVQVLAGFRPFGTTRPGPYGVGGPDVTYVEPPVTTDQTADADLMAAPEAAGIESTSAARDDSRATGTTKDLRGDLLSHFGVKNGDKNPDAIGDELPEGSVDDEELSDGSVDDEPVIEDTESTDGVDSPKPLTPASRPHRREALDTAVTNLRKLVNAGTRPGSTGSSTTSEGTSSNTGNDKGSQGSENDSAA